MEPRSPESDLHVLVTGTSDRLWKIAEPLNKVGDEATTFQITGRESVRPLLKHLLSERPDIVVTDALGRAGAVVYVLCVIFRIPCVLRVRGDAISEQTSVLAKNLRCLSIFDALKDIISLISTVGILSLCNNQVFVSEFCRNRSQVGEFASSEAVVIPTPLRIDNLEVDTENEESNTILSVTNFNFYKKSQGLIDALEPIIRVLDDYPEWTFKIAGGGEYLNEVNSIVDDLDTDSIEVLGYIDDIHEEYRKSDVFVHFSYLDAYPSTVLEASIHNNPIIVNSEVGMSDQIIDGDNGYVVDLDNGAEVERRLANLLESDHQRRVMGDRAADLVRQNNSISEVGNQFHNYFIKIY